jgi:hypothetical protein
VYTVHVWLACLNITTVHWPRLSTEKEETYDAAKVLEELGEPLTDSAMGAKRGKAKKNTLRNKKMRVKVLEISSAIYLPGFSLEETRNKIFQITFLRFISPLYVSC